MLGDYPNGLTASAYDRHMEDSSEYDAMIEEKLRTDDWITDEEWNYAKNSDHLSDVIREMEELEE